MCDIGYTSGGFGGCQPCNNTIPNCVQCNDISYCTQCASGYVLNQQYSQCLSCTSQYRYGCPTQSSSTTSTSTTDNTFLIIILAITLPIALIILVVIVQNIYKCYKNNQQKKQQNIKRNKYLFQQSLHHLDVLPYQVPANSFKDNHQNSLKNTSQKINHNYSFRVSQEIGRLASQNSLTKQQYYILHKKGTDDQTPGECWKYVRRYIQKAAGWPIAPTGYQKACQGGKWLLQTGKFQKIKTTDFKNGDVEIIDKAADHEYGHAQVFYNGKWFSDFKQETRNPWAGVVHEDFIYRYNQ